jgi:hypothetical protein
MHENEADTEAEAERQALAVGLVVVQGQILRAAVRARQGDRHALEELRYLAAHLVLLSVAMSERAPQKPA